MATATKKADTAKTNNKNKKTLSKKNEIGQSGFDEKHGENRRKTENDGRRRRA